MRKQLAFCARLAGLAVDRRVSGVGPGSIVPLPEAGLSSHRDAARGDAACHLGDHRPQDVEAQGQTGQEPTADRTAGG